MNAKYNLVSDMLNEMSMQLLKRAAVKAAQKGKNIQAGKLMRGLANRKSTQWVSQHLPRSLSSLA
jgi:hypothetical protein